MEWSIGVVQQVTKPSDGIQEVSVELGDGSLGKAIYYCDEGLSISLSCGDQVLLNTTAVSLGLGSGGYHFVHSILTPALSPISIASSNHRPLAPGHIMKLRYTSLQRSVLAVEEPDSRYHEIFNSCHSIEGMPVLIGELHSMLPAALCRIRQLEMKQGLPCRVAYIMSDGGALPLAFSKHVAELKLKDWLEGTITYGHAYGGDLEAVNKFTALLAAKHVLHADVAIVLMGPGSVGTGTKLGFSGAEAGELINAVSALQGTPIVIPRLSFADQRGRHQGISHHTLTVLSLIAYARAYVPMPRLKKNEQEWLEKQIKANDISAKHELSWHTPLTNEEWSHAMAAYPLSIISMGRELRDDPACLAGIGAAVDEAWRHWQLQRK